MVTRDSVVWWLGMIGAVLTAIANQAGLFPEEWYRYINLAALLIGVVSGWMKTSPLPGEHDGTKINTHTIVPLILILVLVSGCAPSFKAKLQQADRSVQGALQAIDQTENEFYKAAMVTPAWHKEFSRHMVTALTAGQTFHRSVATYQPGQRIPVDVVALAGALESAADLVRNLPPSEMRSKLAAVLDAAAYVARDLLVLILPRPTVSAMLPAPILASE